MDDRHYRKRLISVVGVLAGVLAIGLLVATFIPAVRDLIGGPGTVMGWVVPLVSIFAIVAITWFLIVRDVQTTDDDTGSASCWSCGHVIMNEWRICPYCGAELRAWKPAAEGSLHRG